MIRTPFRIAAALASIALIVSSVESASVDFLKVSGTEIRTDRGAGDIVHLYGANLGGQFVHETWMSPLSGANCDRQAYDVLDGRFGVDGRTALYDVFRDSWTTDADFERMAAEGLNCVRLPVYYRVLMDSTGAWIRNDQGEIDFSRVDRIVDMAAKHGLWTIFDLHGAPGSQNGADHSGDANNGARLFSDAKWQTMCLDFWQAVAEHYRGDARIAGYDLLNEPSSTFPGAMGSDVIDMYKRIYPVVRAADPDHMIIVEAIWNWNTLEAPSAYGWSNVMYELHCYPWNDQSNLDGLKSFADGHVTSANQYRPQYNVPLLVGEFTFFGVQEAWNYCMKTWTDAGFNWTVWSWKVTGNNSSWGMYTANNAGPNTPDVANDSYESIAAKWANWNIDAYFSRNDMVCNAIRAVTGDARRPEFLDDTGAIAHADEAVTIDGTAESVWDLSTALLVERSVWGAAPSSASDLSAEASILWDAENIYALIHITDNVLSTTATNPWEKDGIELYIDRHNDKSVAYDSSDFQFRVVQGENTATEEKHNATTGVRVAQTVVAGGYVIEMSIPWSTLEGNPGVGDPLAAGELLGIDVHVNDNDGSARKTKIAWNASADNAHLYPSSFGTLELAAPLTAVQGLPSGKGEAFRMTKSLGMLHLSGIASGSIIKLMDLRGRTVASYTAAAESFSVDIRDFAAGAYLVEVTAGNSSRVCRIHSEQ